MIHIFYCSIAIRNGNNIVLFCRVLAKSLKLKITSCLRYRVIDETGQTQPPHSQMCICIVVTERDDILFIYLKATMQSNATFYLAIHLMQMQNKHCRCPCLYLFSETKWNQPGKYVIIHWRRMSVDAGDPHTNAAKWC